MSKQSVQKKSNQYPPWDYSYLRGIVDLCLDDHAAPKAVVQAKLNSLQKVHIAILSYEKEGIARNLLDAVMAKKVDLILKASSLEDIRALGKPSRPYYHNGEVCPSPNTVPEEELILWSIVSPYARLSNEATQRMIKLFKDIYGFFPWDAPKQTADEPSPKTEHLKGEG